MGFTTEKEKIRTFSEKRSEIVAKVSGRTIKIAMNIKCLTFMAPSQKKPNLPYPKPG